MIETYGTIIGLSDDRRVAVVRCHRQSACEGCPSTAACHGGRADRMQIEALNEVGATLNDQVKVVTSSGDFLRSSFILYILPIVGLLGGAATGQWLGRVVSRPLDPALLTALMGVAGLVLAFLMIHRVTRRFKRERFMPRIVAIETPADKQKETI